MALVAIAFGFEGRPSFTVAGAARRHTLFSRLVNVGLKIQRGFGVLRKQRRVARAAIVLGAHHMGRMIKSYVSVFRHEDELSGRRLLFLPKNAERTQK